MILLWAARPQTGHHGAELADLHLPEGGHPIKQRAELRLVRPDRIKAHVDPGALRQLLIAEPGRI